MNVVSGPSVGRISTEGRCIQALCAGRLAWWATWDVKQEKSCPTPVCVIMRHFSGLGWLMVWDTPGDTNLKSGGERHFKTSWAGP